MSYYQPQTGPTYHTPEEPSYGAYQAPDKSAFYDDRTPLANNQRQEHYDGDDKFPQGPSYRDWIFGLLFAFHLIGVFILCGVGMSKDAEVRNDKLDDVIPTVDSKMRTLIWISLGCAGFAIFVSYVWLQIIKRFARSLIIGTVIAGVVLYLGMAIWFFAQGFIVGGVVTLIIALINAWCYFLWRSRIPFATAMLKTIAHLVHDFPGTTYVAYMSLLVQVTWISIWIITSIFVQRIVFKKSDETNPDGTPKEDDSQNVVTGLVTFFLLLSFYWTAQVIKNVVHVTVGGVFASWYFLNNTPSMPTSPTVGALKRATTTSFGSICLGSLIVAFLKTIRTLIQGVRRNNNNLLTCIADCIISIIDRLVEYFNVYAFAQVAIYGKSYCEAAKDTWRLVKSSGVEAIINDNLISGVLLMGTLIGGIVTAALGGILGRIFLEEYWITLAVLGFLIGFVLTMSTMEVVESGVVTIFVCFAMDPAALERNDPYLHQMFRDTYHNYSSFV